MMSTRRALRSEPGINLLLTFDADGVRVLRAGRIRHAPRTGLRAPLLSRESAPDAELPASEFALYVLDRHGAVLERFAYPYWLDEYFDRPGEKHRGELVGPPGRFADGIRMWRFPLAPDAAFLYLVRSDVRRSEPEKGLAFEQQALAMFWICGTPAPPQPPFPPPPPPLPDLAPPRLIPLPILENPFVVMPQPSFSPGGKILGPPVPVVVSGAIDSCFNIVVVGDGFADADMADYDARVRALFCGPATSSEVGTYTPACASGGANAAACPGLRHLSPFSKIWDRVNVWSVRTQSTQSGITIPGCGHADCSQPVLKSTYYEVEGCFNKPYPGYTGAADPTRIVTAASLAVPPEYQHLIIVISNFKYYGGRAVPGEGMAFVTMDPAGMSDWVRLVSHECGHVIGNLAEERIVCKHKDGSPLQPNQAPKRDVQGATVWWKCLAKADDLDAQGQFKAIHRYGGPMDANGQPVMGAGLYGMLGAFWGCQNITGQVDTPLNCDSYDDVRGQDFFRPMAECRMRWLTMEFCRVCDYEITSRILDTCGVW